MNFEPGDVVANKYGHVMAIRRVDEESGLAICFYECNPEVFNRYKLSELRLLSKTRGVDMGCWNSGLFMETIRRQAEWSKKVAGLPREVAERKDRKEVQRLAELPTEELIRMLKEGKKR